MTLDQLFKSIIDQDEMPIVVCDASDTIVYMNPAGIEHYSGHGGEILLGRNIHDCHNPRSSDLITKVTKWFAESKDHNKIHTFYDERRDKDVYMVALRDDDGELIGYYEKHESRKRDDTPRYNF